jgi:WD40 repeat protein
MSRPDSGIDRHETSHDGANTASSGTIDFLFWLSQLACDPLAKRSANETLFSGPRPFGHFQLESLLGTGTYGAVFRAVDLELDRAVALKVAWPAVLLDPEASRRFVEEPKTVAALEHPGIVRVYDSGNIEMARYIALELIEGPTLAEWAKAQYQVPVAVALQVVQRVAEALGYAHRHGIVHRDLKPSNILLRSIPSGSDSLTFDPVVTDFGLARRQTMSDATNATATHAILGTDRYMSPEQASGLAKEVGSESDVFSLGVILYELLAGRRPFDGESGEAIRAQIQRDDPPKLRPWRNSVHRDIETIVFKCLEKSARRRYANAGELADDLRRFQLHEPIKARPASALTKAWKFARRRPLLVASTAAGIVGGIVVSALMGAVIEDRRSSARELAAAREAAVAAEGMERQHQYATSIRYAARSFHRGNKSETLHHLKEAKELAQGRVQLGLEWRLLGSMADDAHRILPANFGSVRGLRFSPVDDVLICGGSDNRLIFWDTLTWKPTRTVFNTGRAVNCAEFSHDGTLLAVGGENGRVVVHRIAENRVIFDEKLFDTDVFSVAWLGGQQRLAAGGRDAMLAIVEPIGGKVRRTGPVVSSDSARGVDPSHPNEISAVAYLPTRDLVAVLKAPGEIVLFDPESLKETARWNDPGLHSSAGSLCAVSMQSDFLALAGAASIKLVSAAEGELVASLALGQLISDIRFSPATRLLIGCFRDGSIQTWSIDDLLAGRPATRHRFVGHQGRATACDISRDGQWLVSGGQDRALHVWARPLDGPSSETPMANEPVHVQFSPCGKWLALIELASPSGGSLSLYDATTGRRRWSIPQTLPELVRSRDAHQVNWDVAFEASGESVLVREPEGELGHRDCKTGELLKRVEVAELDRASLVSCPNPRQLLLRGMPEPRLIDLDTSSTLFRLSGSRDMAGCFRMPGGELWIETDSRHRCYLKRSPEGAPFRVLGPTDERILTVAITRDGRYLAAAGLSMTIYLVDLTSDSAPVRLLANDLVSRVAFTKDGQTLLSQSSSGSLTFWHVPTKSELLTIGSPGDPIVCLALHPSDEGLVLGIQHGTRFSLRAYSFRESGHTVARSFEVTSPSEEPSAQR